MEDYQPELGQAVFGQPWNKLTATKPVKIALSAICNIMRTKAKDDYTPFDNSGVRFKNDVFEANAYDWSECSCDESWEADWTDDKCTCGYKPQLYNFKWMDFEVSWYKHSLRGTSMNREISDHELVEMLDACTKSLLD